jgi:hypothetical protein
MRELCRDYYVGRTISRAEFLSTRSLLVRQAETLSRSNGRRREVTRVLSAAQPRHALDVMSVDVVRDLLGARLERVTVGRFTGGRRVFDARRLKCEWLTASTGDKNGDVAQMS